MGNVNETYTYKLTPLQKGMLYNSFSNPNSGVEIEQIICTIKEPLNLSAFCRAWEQVIDRHHILRTKFLWQDRIEPRQVVETHVGLPMKYHDWRSLPPKEQNIRLREFIDVDRLNDFCISDAPLMRLALFELNESLHKCIWTFHHALLDGRSFPIVLKEVFGFYEAYSDNTYLELDFPQPYHKYIDWLYKRDLTQDEKFWKQTLQGFNAHTPLPIMCSSYPNKEVIGNATEEIRLSVKLTGDLESFAQNHDLTVNTLVHGAWALLLHHYSGEDDVVFGSTWSCRHATVDGAESMVGLFINTLPMRVKMSDDESLVPWLKRLRRQHVELRKYLYTPLNKIQQWSNVDPGSPLFESLVVFENYVLDAALRAQGGRWHNREFLYRGQTNFPLVLAGYYGEEILLRLEYAPNCFDLETIRRVLGHLQVLLSGMVSNPELPAVNIPYLTSNERNQLVVEWNDTQADYPRDMCIHELFEAQVKKTPGTVAVTFGGVSLTYFELNAKSNQLAYHLCELGVKPETMVGLCFERSLEMIIGILAILKAGGAYVPLDPEYPQARLMYMLEDTNTQVLLTQAKEGCRSPKCHAKIICFDMDSLLYADQPSVNPQSGASGTSLAYVMYTSGSTGRPKGIEVTHRNVLRLVKNSNYANLDEKEVLLQYAPISFDASTFEIWGALLNGGRLVISPLGQLSPSELGQIIKTNGVTTIWLTSGLFHNIVEYNLDCLRSVRQILAGGDVLAPSSVKKVLKEINDVRLINGYGPTENTTFTCCYSMTASSQIGTSIPIGRPISNTKVYILDKLLNPVPIGVPGELYTSGDGLARGYLKRPDLTKSVFLRNPFSEDRDSKLYKTGDLARFLPDGNIEFLGRIDHQVKLRGFRIELGEIETVLSMHDAVSQVVATVREDRPGDKRLVAYFISQAQVPDLTEELRKYLSKELPQYMIPKYFIRLDSFPLTSNGKIDRKRLPAPNIDLDTSEFVAPCTKLEAQIARIWQELIGIERVSVHNNFFEIGGDSLMSVCLFSELYELTGKNLPLSTLLEAPTVRKLALAFGGQEVSDNKEAKEPEPDDSGYPDSQLSKSIAAETKDELWSSLVEIKPDGIRPPFFCFHAAGGNVLNYSVIGENLEPDQPMYGLQSRGLDGLTRPFKSIEKMATHYMDEIKAIQPHGLYFLGGGSMGGMIAFEVAQQLQGRGEDVPFLVLFDTLGPYEGLTLSGEVKGFRAKVQKSISLMAGQSIEKRIRYIFDRLSLYLRHHFKMFLCSAYQILKRPIPHELRYWYIEEINKMALNNYSPKPYNGQITLIRGSLKPKGVYSDSARGWTGVASGGLKIEEVQGEHEEIVEQPDFLKKLSDLLQEVEMDP